MDFRVKAECEENNPILEGMYEPVLTYKQKALTCTNTDVLPLSKLGKFHLQSLSVTDNYDVKSELLKLFKHTTSSEKWSETEKHS